MYLFALVIFDFESAITLGFSSVHLSVTYLGYMRVPIIFYLVSYRVLKRSKVHIQRFSRDTMKWRVVFIFSTSKASPHSGPLSLSFFRPLTHISDVRVDLLRHFPSTTRLVLAKILVPLLVDDFKSLKGWHPVTLWLEVGGQSFDW